MCWGRAQEKSLPSMASHSLPSTPETPCPFPVPLLPEPYRPQRAGAARKALPPHRCFAGYETLEHGAGIFSQTAKCKPYYFWISKTIINT